ncbi:DUF3857 domain-containing protein [Fodinibius sp.]|uniref:DUF3857 domain-containing protein n=1 Tax=Fodinibius sp. TaxID=1872440 RepID=UPI002ACEB345|nr:DUF3857 domain-containing protein [Fodinibius sp.]MDZ7658470.1 DUF3857 domain-containing protein [Fodinibius sp.]
MSSKFELMAFLLDRFFLITVFIVLLGISGVSAQHVPDAEFGSIPDSLFQMQQPGNDTPYRITNKELDVSFQEANESIVAVLEHHIRIKVFDDSVREASVVAIPYYFDNDMERVTSLEAYTYLPSGERAALSEQDIRTININSRYSVKEFAMPAVVEGAVIEYRYTIERRYIEELPDFYLSHEVPTDNAKLTITYPKYLRYQSFIENFEGKIKHDVVYTDTSSVPKVFTIPQPQPIVTERWMARDIPPVKEEAYISTLDDYRGKIKFLLSEFGIPRQQLENNWEVVVARIRDKTDPWESINKNSAAKVKSDSIEQALDIAPKRQIQDSIYHYLNKRVNFSGQHTAFSQASGKEVLAGESSSQAAINQTLVAMLRAADIDAHPVLISTRKSGKINMDFPSFYQFNGLMVRSEINGESYLMDAGFPYSQPGLIPVDTYGSRGLVLRKDGYEWIDINPDKSLFDIQVQIDGQLERNGTIKGTVDAVQQGYPAQIIRQKKADGNSESEILRQTLFDGYPQMRISDIKVNNAEKYGQPIAITADFEIENYATSFTDGLKFRPLIVGYRNENPFSGPDRNLPITLDAPEKLDLSYSIELPAGYTIAVNDDRTIRFSGAEFIERYDNTSGQLNYRYQINIDQRNFSADYFPSLYKLYNRWVELSNSSWLIEE